MRSKHQNSRSRAGVVATACVLGLCCWSGMAATPAHAQTTSRKLTNFEAASHVLNRLAFGPRAGEVPDTVRMGWQDWAEQQLEPDKIDDSAAEKMIAERCPSLSWSLTKLYEHEGKKDDKKDALKKELADSVLLRAVYSQRQFQEVMVEFWRNHFNVDFNKVPYLAAHYEEHAIREHVFGRFEDLLLATAKHPAMRVYLDNYISRRYGINENYGRELMELHTLRADNGYTQHDVIDLARVLTGWTCGWRPGPSERRQYESFFDSNMHDTGPASVVGLSLDGRAGEEEGERAIHHLARLPGTAHFISLKLCRYLVNDNPPETLVERTAQAFQRHLGDLREVYRAILFSPEFMEAANYRAKFKTPFMFVASALRTTDANIESTDRLHEELKLMGQPLCEFLEPTGYSQQAEAWRDPGIMVYRWNLAIEIVQGKLDGVKIGPAFEKQMLKKSNLARTKQAMLMVLPGVNDAATEKLISQSGDLQVMVALALGSPGFQQR